MKEEFHGDQGVTPNRYQLTYGWNLLTANVWLPSLSELIGTTGDPDTQRDCYQPAMQGTNFQGTHYTDAKGGTQFAYFQQYNTAGGGEAIWNVCGEEASWTRSSDTGHHQKVWIYTGISTIRYYLATEPHAVHPAVSK